MSPCSTAQSFEEKTRIKVPAGPGMQIFSPDGKYGYVCSSFNPETDVITVADHQIVGHVKQASPFCPNIAATPDGKQVWFTLKDIGKTEVFDAQPPFAVLKIARHRADHQPRQLRPQRQRHLRLCHDRRPERGARCSAPTISRRSRRFPVGKLPHGIWPSGDGSRVYVGLENADGMAAIDTLTNKVIATSPIGQAPQAITYVPNAVPEGDGTQGLQPLGVAGETAHLLLEPTEGRKTVDSSAGTGRGDKASTSVSLFDQGLIQVLQAAVTGLEPKQPYVLALSHERDGQGPLEPLAAFMTNPAGSAIVNATGPIRQVVHGEDRIQRRYLVIAEGHADKPGHIVQVQLK